jgi:uncharacterized 2Fe-2S/4Fe-4S cluster protein (DUF4445 family)
MTDEVIFQPMGRRVVADPGKTILEMARQAGVGFEATCGGKGLCGKCKVIPSGAAAPPSVLEIGLLGQDGHHGARLACQTRLPRGGTVWVPEESRLRKQSILTTGQQVELRLDPMLQVHDLEIQPPSQDNPYSMNELLQEGLEWAAPGHVPLSVLQDLPDVFTEVSGQVSVVTRLGHEILDVAPGWGRQCLGLAVDLGTTTVVVYLLDLLTAQPLAVEADMNPQVYHGDDVISRIAHCQENSDGLQKLGAQIRECIARLARQACRTAGVNPHHIMDCVMVGNTAMHHIFLGLNPMGLAQAPYTPVTNLVTGLKAKQVGLAFAEEAWLHWLPVKAGFVGADTVAVALAVRANQVSEPTLILDLGTNGEMILAIPETMTCCSAAAGPAFEGGHTTYGMRAAPGAVESVKLDPVSLENELSVIGGEKPLGLCGSGLLSLISQLAKAGAILPGGSFNHRKACSRLRTGSEGMEYVLAFAGQSGLGRDLVLTSRDVAEVQLAKGAIRAGVEIMMHELGVENLDKVLLAGAFGNYINPQEARDLGLFPPLKVDRIQGIGNAAGAGAIMALISREERNQADIIARDLNYIELTTHAQFQDLFIDSMTF